MKNEYKNFGRKTSSEDITWEINGRVMLERILKKWSVWVLNGFSWLRTMSITGLT
jgi:hypothetical protein